MSTSEGGRRRLRRWRMPVAGVVALTVVLGSLTLFEQTGAGAATKRTTWSAPAWSTHQTATVAVGNPGLAQLQVAQRTITRDQPAAVPGAVMAAFSRATQNGLQCRAVSRAVDRVIALLRQLEQRYPFLTHRLDAVIHRLQVLVNRICRRPSGG